MDDVVQSLREACRMQRKQANWLRAEAQMRPEAYRQPYHTVADQIDADIDAKLALVEKYAEVADNDVDEPYEYAYGYANALGEAVRLFASEQRP